MAFLWPFADAYRTPTLEALTTSAKSLRNAMTIGGHKLLARTLDGTVENMPEIFDAEQQDIFNEKRYVTTSLNCRYSYRSLRHAERLLKELDASDVDLVHDNSLEFEAGFKWAFEVFGNAQEATTQLQNGTEVYFGLTRVRNFRMGDSPKSLRFKGLIFWHPRFVKSSSTSSESERLHLY